MKTKILFLIILVFTLGFRFLDDPKKLEKQLDDDNSKYTNVGSIGLTVTNFGLFGHGFTKWPKQPSLEYPKGSSIENLYASGIWVGGFQDGIFKVSTGAVDVSSLSSKGGGFEYTNDSGKFVSERSSILTSKFYDPKAVSHQDFLADYSDTNTKLLNGAPIPNHQPLGIKIHQQSYAWNYSFADFFVILNFYIVNVGKKKIDSVYAGLYADLVVRNTLLNSPRSGAEFYKHGANGYIDSLRMAYAFEYDGYPNPPASDGYVGMKYLGSERTINNKLEFVDTAHYHVFQFNSPSDLDYPTPTTDIDKYARMSKGLTKEKIDPLNDRASNRSTYIGSGSYGTLNPGDTLNVTFAFVCARKSGTDPSSLDSPEQKRSFVSNAIWAQRAYNGEDRNGNHKLDPGEDLDYDGKITRYILPTPPNPPRVKVIPENNKVSVYWDKSSENSTDPISGKKDFEGYKVYRTNAGADVTSAQDLKTLLILAAEFDSLKNDIGMNTGFSAIELNNPVTFPNDTIKYSYKMVFDNLLNGWQYIYSVTAFDKGDLANNLDQLEVNPIVTANRVLPGTPATSNSDVEVGVYPNPYYANAIWDGSSERQRKIYFYNLPASCEITIYTLAGDIVSTMQHDQAYNGSNIGWFQSYSKEGNQKFAGGEHAWDLLSTRDQAIATGLYLFTVKDNSTGDIKRGKFLIIK